MHGVVIAFTFLFISSDAVSCSPEDVKRKEAILERAFIYGEHRRISQLISEWRERCGGLSQNLLDLKAKLGEAECFRYLMLGNIKLIPPTCEKNEPTCRRMQAVAKQKFIEGYVVEVAHRPEAIAKWEEVLSLGACGEPWRTKARLKIQAIEGVRKR